MASKAVAAVTAEEEAEAARVAMHGPLQVQLRSGQSFGELAFVTAHKRNATVIALQECHLIKARAPGGGTGQTKAGQVRDRVGVGRGLGEIGLRTGVLGCASSCALSCRRTRRQALAQG